jgi:hypothetical protein
VISGALEKGDQEGGAAKKILVDKVQRAQDLFKTGKRLTMRLGAEPEAHEETTRKLALLKEIMVKHPGSTSFVLQIEIPELEKIVDLEVSDPKGIEPSQVFFEKLTGVFGESKWTLS